MKALYKVTLSCGHIRKTWLNDEYIEPQYTSCMAMNCSIFSLKKIITREKVD